MTASKFIAFSLAVTIVFSCNTGSDKKSNSQDSLESINSKKDSVKVVEKIILPEHPIYNDLVKFIAGIKLDSSAVIKKSFFENKVWKDYAADFNKNWDKITSQRLTLMNEWATTELKNEREKKRDVFYPFSGPDILHAITFFPDAKNYYLFALEKQGALPDYSKIDTAWIKGYLGSVNKSLEDIFNKSYFITRKMWGDLSKQEVNGTIPLICIFLVRTGNSIIDIKYLHMEKDGSINETEVDSLKNYVRIDFRKNKDADIQSVYYFNTNIADDGLKRDNGMQKFLDKMDTCYTYVKSASYLLHYGSFSSVRNVILKKSKTVLEDDTGIPYKYFDEKEWKVSLYGNYVKPVRDFSGVYQEDLDKKYKADSTVQKLKFSLGYHWGQKNTQNLIKAQSIK